MHIPESVSKGFLVFLLVLAAACTPQMELHLRRVAADDLNCSEKELWLQEEASLYRVSGCGRYATYQCSKSHVRCANLDVLAHERGRRELSCEAVEVRGVSPRVYLVRGCGYRVTYQCAMKDGIGQCTSETAPVREEQPRQHEEAPPPWQ